MDLHTVFYIFINQLIKQVIAEFYFNHKVVYLRKGLHSLWIIDMVLEVMFFPSFQSSLCPNEKRSF